MTITPTPPEHQGQDVCLACACEATPRPNDDRGLERELKALADPARLRLLRIIAAHPGGRACICQLTEPLGLTQPTISHHMRLLAESGFVTRERRGKWVYYTIMPEALADLARRLTDLAASGTESHVSVCASSGAAG
ncbi:metalloregulator ArsR/SmtB family transcription factor [uncultured Bifidobacterium sp.]|uniref:ArsR/SmtB family transcription factor n=1 Tax=uncultured Bifidobacterium sp. TaxID=165187 RepID=UPI0028DB6CDE|nr:metalloregulator ArsR/SmtB family transcription factor [uncultured Bifidobacterium sp.]